LKEVVKLVTEAPVNRVKQEAPTGPVPPVGALAFRPKKPATPSMEEIGSQYVWLQKAVLVTKVNQWVQLLPPNPRRWYFDYEWNSIGPFDNDMIFWIGTPPPLTDPAFQEVANFAVGPTNWNEGPAGMTSEIWYVCFPDVGATSPYVAICYGEEKYNR
jgi:hypothetical protein